MSFERTMRQNFILKEKIDAPASNGEKKCDLTCNFFLKKVFIKRIYHFYD